MPPAGYEIRCKPATLEQVQKARERVLARLGNAKIAERLTRLTPEDAGAFANDLLALLDAVDALVSRAKPTG